VADLIERTMALIALRPGREAALSGALAAMGQALPPMGRFTQTGGLLLARAAPFQILAMRPGADAPLLDELAPLAEEAGLIDLSDARIGVCMAGDGVRSRLAQLLTLDLDAFAPGHCAQTLMAHLSVLVLRHSPDEVEIQASRSYAGSFLRAIDAAA
jgi:heterotetrameric sarcosine oxidase gamma subunit